VCLWFFAKDKGKRAGEVLFIDAREMGYMVDRAERALTDEDVVKIGDTFHAWLGSRSAASRGIEYTDVRGFCRSVSLADIKESDYALNPGRYVGAAEADDDGEPAKAKIERLTAALIEALDGSREADAAVRAQLERLHG
jgi:type I restriction enzyme M protein